MTLLTALLIAGACICLNLLLYRSGATGMDSLNGYIMQYQPCLLYTSPSPRDS